MPYDADKAGDLKDMREKLEKTYSSVSDTATRQAIHVFNSVMEESKDEGQAWASVYSTMNKRGLSKKSSEKTAGQPLFKREYGQIQELLENLYDEVLGARYVNTSRDLRPIQYDLRHWWLGGGQHITGPTMASDLSSRIEHLATAVESGTVMGPGVPDGTGPHSNCPHKQPVTPADDLEHQEHSYNVELAAHINHLAMRIEAGDGVSWGDSYGAIQTAMTALLQVVDDPDALRVLNGIKDQLDEWWSTYSF